jgi:hypothetical protein
VFYLFGYAVKIKSFALTIVWYEMRHLRLSRAARFFRDRSTLRVGLARCSLQALGIARGENDAGALDTGSAGSFQPDAGAAG